MDAAGAVFGAVALLDTVLAVDLIEQHFKFKVPERMGLNTVDPCTAMLDGRVRGFVSLGGNFLRAVPDTGQIEPAWQRLALNVQVATKLNHSHLLPGEQAWLLPCLGRIAVSYTHLTLPTKA